MKLRRIRFDSNAGWPSAITLRVLLALSSAAKLPSNSWVLRLGQMGVYLTPVTQHLVVSEFRLCRAFDQGFVGAAGSTATACSRSETKQLGAAARFAPVEAESELIE
jgi:hypothetical protein